MIWAVWRKNIELDRSEVAYLKNGLLVLGEGIFTNQLHNFD